MKKLLAFLSITFLFIGLSSTAGALTIFEDNFNSGSAGLNYDSFANWTVSDGSVDVIGVGTVWNWFPAYGLYVDMDGSSGDAGTISHSLFLTAGQYKLSFDLAGNQRNAAEEMVTFEVQLGVFSDTYKLFQNDPFESFSETLTIASDNTYTISFGGDGGDNVGMLLDNVKLESVPEPATMLLLGTGLIGLAGLGRKKLFKK